MILSETEEVTFFNPITGLPIGNVLFSFKPMLKINKTKFEEISSKDELNLLTNDDKSKKNPIHRFKFDGYTVPSTMDLYQ
ncbi:hypothetical protein PYV02_15350 [Leifsonia sp. H3M29-4]|uniref:Uncharacterized protein n=1 Tax=Pseudonocardia yuanmonensis TaxID=1095914 RepID=A0ABP8XXZ7_9PSEU|nr:hypothetical protein [Salinibacterium metalliresistens]MDF1480455.1 hypothetical protein [Salinibacterium metalliresistens]